MKLSQELLLVLRFMMVNPVFSAFSAVYTCVVLGVVLIADKNCYAYKARAADGKAQDCMHIHQSNGSITCDPGAH